MGQKNLGPAVSGYLDPDGRAFESAVYQAGKPVLDKELNLSDELAAAAGISLVRRMATSGWLTDDPLNKSDSLSGVFTPTTTPDLVSLSNDLRAFVNGWLIEVQNTNSSSANEITLDPAPSGNGAKRTDLIILEVWRRLISPSPSTDGKSTGGRIWRHGNVKVPSGSDAVLNFPDDILDGTLNSETTKRVQIQYRLRAISGVDLFAYPMGIDDPVVVAHSVPALATSPDGVATAYTYANQSSNGDPGLWRAGDGNPLNDLGTVDGYMYAIPLIAVFRRNSSAWDRNLNHNGATAYPAVGDRPDGLHHDIIVLNDIADLRIATSLSGWSSYQEIGEKNFGYLLDNVLKTEWSATSLGGGVNGHTLFMADEIGTLPGDGVVTGDTPGAEFIGQFDCTRRFFSDRPVYEVLTFAIDPSDPNVSTNAWQAGTQVTINPAQIAQYPYSGTISWLSRAPSGTRIVDVLKIWVQGTTSGEEAAEVGMVYASAPSNTPVPWPVESISGMGEYPPGNIVITLGTPPVGGFTTETMYIDLLVAYPPGQGLTRTPVGDFGANSFQHNNPGALPSTAPVSYNSDEIAAMDPVHREVHLQYRTENLIYTFTSNSTDSQPSYVLPERVVNLIDVQVNGNPAGAVTIDPSGRILTFSSPPSPGSEISVEYQAQRPYPQYNGFQMTIYYEYRAAQTIRSSLLGTTATLIPRWVSPHLYCITAGSGSQEEGYPYPFAYVQTGGVIKDGVAFSGEHELDGAVEVFVADFNASTGFVKVPAYVPYVPSPEGVTFTRNLNDTDIEERTYFPTVPAGYIPNAFGQNLSNERVHKVVLPMVMEAASDTTFGKKGTLFLALFTRWAAFDAENSVKFLPSNNTTTASLFRLSGNLINRRS